MKGRYYNSLSKEFYSPNARTRLKFDEEAGQWAMEYAPVDRHEPINATPVNWQHQGYLGNLYFPPYDSWGISTTYEGKNYYVVKTPDGQGDATTAKLDNNGDIIVMDKNGTPQGLIDAALYFVKRGYPITLPWYQPALNLYRDIYPWKFQPPTDPRDTLRPVAQSLISRITCYI